MKKLPVFKYLKYLIWLGPMLMIAGVSAGVVSGGWTAVPIALILVGLALIGVGLIAMGRVDMGGQPGAWNQRSLETGANALVTTLAVLAILGLINFLGAKYAWRVDLTENQQFTLSPQTQNVVRNLQEPVKVWVFDKQQNPQDRALLENYRRAGNKFSFEYVDPQAELGLAKQFEVKNFGDVVLELQPNNKRKQFVQTVSDRDRLSEAKLTNGLEQILSDRRANIYFLQGHGERPLEAGQPGAMSQAVKLLGEKNLVAKPLTLAASKEFPQDAAAVVIAGPQKPLLDGEVQALKNYLQRGGHLLLMVDPTNTDPKLDTLLKDWGITLDKRVAIDGSGGGKLINLGPADAIVTRYGDHPITKELQGNLSFFSLARPVQSTSVKDVKETPLLFTSDNSWAESNLQTQPLEFNPPADLQGPLVLGIALEKQTAPKSRLVVIGNSTFATDGLFDQVVNGDVFLNSVRWLEQPEQSTLSIRPKDTKNRRINLTAQQANLSSLLALILLPLLGFGTAAYVWWRRR